MLNIMQPLRNVKYSGALRIENEVAADERQGSGGTIKASCVDMREWRKAAGELQHMYAK